MSKKRRINLRQTARVNYYEPEEPNLDEYVFCSECGDFVYEYCSIHGPLLVIPDDKVPLNPDVPSFVPRAALTIPHVFLHLNYSSIPGAGLGVFTTLTLPRGVRFGPYRGSKSDKIKSSYCWQIRDANNRPCHVMDASDANNSNWMRYVNCSRHWFEQNLVAYQYRGQIYYRTIKIIPRFTELMVFYGSEFACELGIDLKKYNAPSTYAQKLGTQKTTQDDVKKTTIPVNSTQLVAISKEDISVEDKLKTIDGKIQENTVNLTHEEKDLEKIHNLFHLGRADKADLGRAATLNSSLP
ncbi:histone-lysine N-methyltransferase set-17-like [Aricia agestis]|uniref:histone-lysine N-methyltransferase set-17-like n=1 Tax=Aricia agestis TaxID=91739 RepID=UPI001C20B458|nr:histone-lysine N-methyltransferase set-17-like [Aricia agestis]